MAYAGLILKDNFHTLTLKWALWHGIKLVCGRGAMLER